MSPRARLVYLIFLSVAAVSCGGSGSQGRSQSSADDPPDPGPPSETTPAPAAEARQVADRMATEELARVESHHRERDPEVSLPLSDYEVTVSETEVPEPAWVFLYRYARTDPPFELWAGHGMHFSVRVPKGGGQPQMIGGE